MADDLEPVGEKELKRVASETVARAQYVVTAERVTYVAGSGLLSGGSIAAFLFTRSWAVLFLSLVWPFLFPLLSAFGLAALERLAPLVTERLVTSVESLLRDPDVPKIELGAIVLVPNPSLFRPYRGQWGRVVGRDKAKWLVRLASGRAKWFKQHQIQTVELEPALREVIEDEQNQLERTPDL